jgi:transcriptional regulator GlxA family with amidase domain
MLQRSAGLSRLRTGDVAPLGRNVGCHPGYPGVGLHAEERISGFPTGMDMEKKRVGIVVFDDIEVLDFCGPFEVFSVVRLNEEKRREELSPFEVLLVAEKNGPVITTGGMKVIPDHTFENCPRLDILVVPGGWGTRKELKNPAMLNWLRIRAAEVETLTSVCTGSMLLGFAGLLDGRHATTHWRSLDWMRESFPSVTVEYDKHVVEDGRLFTSAGISAGIDMALKVVGRYCGEAIARATANHMEYPYPDDNARRVTSRSIIEKT